MIPRLGFHWGSGEKAALCGISFYKRNAQNGLRRDKMLRIILVYCVDCEAAHLFHRLMNGGKSRVNPGGHGNIIEADDLDFPGDIQAFALADGYELDGGDVTAGEITVYIRI